MILYAILHNLILLLRNNNMSGQITKSKKRSQPKTPIIFINQSEAQALLGVSATTLYRYVKKYKFHTTGSYVRNIPQQLKKEDILKLVEIREAKKAEKGSLKRARRVKKVSN